MSHPTTNRRAIIDALCYGRDPFANPPDRLSLLDLQGWRSLYPFLDGAVTEFRPGVIVEIGARKGVDANSPRTCIGRGPQTGSTPVIARA